MAIVVCPRCESKYDPGMESEIAAVGDRASLKVICPVCSQWLRLPENEAIDGPRLPPHVLQAMKSQSKLIERGSKAPDEASAPQYVGDTSSVSEKNRKPWWRIW